jgi:hypothetical protein
MAAQINLDTAQRVDITCRKGDSFRLELTFNDDANAVLDLTGYVWKLDVRETDTSASAIIEDDAFTYSGTDEGVLTITASPANYGRRQVEDFTCTTYRAPTLVLLRRGCTESSK